MGISGGCRRQWDRASDAARTHACDLARPRDRAGIRARRCISLHPRPVELSGTTTLGARAIRHPADARPDGLCVRRRVMVQYPGAGARGRRPQGRPHEPRRAGSARNRTAGHRRDVGRQDHRRRVVRAPVRSRRAARAVTRRDSKATVGVGVGRTRPVAGAHSRCGARSPTPLVCQAPAAPTRAGGRACRPYRPLQGLSQHGIQHGWVVYRECLPCVCYAARSGIAWRYRSS